MNSAKEIRRLQPFNAAVAGVFGFGLGYLYVGRLRLSFLPFATYLALILVIGVTRVITEPIGLYSANALMLTIWLISIVHPAVFASKHENVASRSYNRGWIYLLWVIVVGLLVNQIASHRGALFGFETYRIPSASMAPTLENGDWILADTWIFNESEPAFRDLIVHNLPNNRDILYVKRIIGLPGDTIEINDNVLIRNGIALEENYIMLTDSMRAHVSEFSQTTVPADHYFVLGDNRHNARDSRFIGAVPKASILGRVEHRWFAYNEGIRWERFPEHLSETVN